MDSLEVAFKSQTVGLRRLATLVIYHSPLSYLHPTPFLPLSFLLPSLLSLLPTPLPPLSFPFPSLLSLLPTPLPPLLSFQVIVLNSTGQAEGELYVDDGHSYNFQEGAFLHRRFVFANGQLSNSDYPSSLNSGSPANKGLTKKAEEVAKAVGVDIERIVMVGLPAADVAARQKKSKEGVLTEVSTGTRMVQASKSTDTLGSCP